MNKIRIRATLFAMGIMLILVAYFGISIYQDKKRVLDEKTHSHRELLKNAFELSVLDTEKGLNHFACKLMADQHVVNAFEAQDRDALYKLALPYFNDAHERGDVDLTGFIRHDGVHFLRLQDPKKFGDNITKKRPMLAEAIRTRKPMVSMDVTLYNISLVSIIPVFKDHKFLGVIQASADISRIQERLNGHSGIKTALAYDSKILKNLLPSKELTQYGPYSIISSNHELFDHLPRNYAYEHSMRHTIDGITYIVASRELRTYADKPLARMICALDITDDEISYQNEIKNLFIISIVMLMLLAIILHIGFKALIDRINRKSAQLTQQLEDQLYNDVLTGLPNRKQLLKNLKNEHYIAILLLNIDNFKEINDLYGHEIGDKILQAIGDSLRSMITSYPLSLYKMHSDEYALALREYVNVDKFDTMCQEILSTLHETTYEIDGITIFITFSMGTDICFESGCDLMGRADMALKTAKKRSLPYVKYHDTLHIKEQYENNILWSKKLKEAVSENRFQLYYQSIHNASNDQIDKYEALIRFVDTDGMVVTPVAFLEIAKKARLYPHITKFVIDTIFDQLEKTDHRYSINLSIDDLLHHETKTHIYEKLAECNVGDRLVFELLESEGIENYEEVSGFIAHVKEYGCKIAIDDFGTGYSNFAHIMRLNVDYIKIDGSLIKRLDYDLSAQDIVQTIVEFAHRLNIKTVAEFVSSKDIYDECKELGIDYLQGYYLGEPKPL